MTLNGEKLEATKYRAAIHECIAEIDRILKGMKRKQARIDKLGAHTRAMLARVEGHEVKDVEGTFQPVPPTAGRWRRIRIGTGRSTRSCARSWMS